MMNYKFVNTLHTLEGQSPVCCCNITENIPDHQILPCGGAGAGGGGEGGGGGEMIMKMNLQLEHSKLTKDRESLKNTSTHSTDGLYTDKHTHTHVRIHDNN